MVMLCLLLGSFLITIGFDNMCEVRDKTSIVELINSINPQEEGPEEAVTEIDLVEGKIIVAIGIVAGAGAYYFFIKRRLKANDCFKYCGISKFDTAVSDIFQLSAISTLSAVLGYALFLGTNQLMKLPATQKTIALNSVSSLVLILICGYSMWGAAILWKAVFKGK
jgi:hypothetical protein